jgi:endonuclease/exonuclease/phosphatase (EEP) superfamily protein YafD
VVNGRHDPTNPSGLVAPTIYWGPGFAIDYIWVRGAASVAEARLTLDRPSDADSGLYPSDHRGVVAELDLGGSSAA